MRCPYCGNEDIEPVDPDGEGGRPPVVKCTRCGSELDPIALATRIEAEEERSQGVRRAGLLLGVPALMIAVAFVVLGARHHSAPAPAPVPTASQRAPAPSIPPRSVPAPAPRRSPAQIAAPYPTTAETVYVTRSGKKYHRLGCRYIDKSRRPMSRREAQREGYTACTVCDP